LRTNRREREKKGSQDYASEFERGIQAPEKNAGIIRHFRFAT
jgi:hypothetical protein